MKAVLFVIVLLFVANEYHVFPYRTSSLWLSRHPFCFLFPFCFGLYFIPQGRNTYVAFFELSAIGSLSLKIVSASYLRPHSSTV